MGQALWGRRYVWGRPYGADAVGLPHRLERAVWGRRYGAGAMCGAGPMGLTQWGCPIGWNELLIASFSHRSIAVQDGILLATGLHVHRSSAHSAGVGAIFDR